jgi:hypothetical protein
MKRIITLFILISAGLIAKGNHSTVNLRMHNGSFFTVVFDHAAYHNPTREFNIDVAPGLHDVAIYKMKHHGPYHSYPVLVYRGRLEVPHASAVEAVIRQGRLEVTNIIALYPPAPVPCSAGYGVMSEHEYADLVSIIRNKSFDSSRLAIAKDAVRNHPMSSRQISGLLDLLSFDSSRLELAKYAYRYVADPGSYFITYDQFTFDSSVTELIDYINRNS